MKRGGFGPKVKEIREFLRNGEITDISQLINTTDQISELYKEFIEYKDDNKTIEAKKTSLRGLLFLLNRATSRYNKYINANKKSKE